MLHNHAKVVKEWALDMALSCYTKTYIKSLTMFLVISI